MGLITIYSPEKFEINEERIAIFIGGSIELGEVRDWQKDLVRWLEEHEYADYLVAFNPRRPQWDTSWPIDDPNHKELREQIEWELKMQDIADIPVYLFASKTLSPITLLELGLYAGKNPVVCVETNYKRAANVIVTAEHFGWQYSTEWDAFLIDLDARIRKLMSERFTLTKK